MQSGHLEEWPLRALWEKNKRDILFCSPLPLASLFNKFLGIEGGQEIPEDVTAIRKACSAGAQELSLPPLLPLLCPSQRPSQALCTRAPIDSTTPVTSSTEPSPLCHSYPVTAGQLTTVKFLLTRAFGSIDSTSSCPTHVRMRAPTHTYTPS